MTHENLSSNQPVIVFGLGDNKEYLGRIRGLGYEGSYIVECDYPKVAYGYPCFVVPEGCVRSITEASYEAQASSTRGIRERVRQVR